MFSLSSKPVSFSLILVSAVLFPNLRLARAEFSGTPLTFQVNGGWCWFQDPRAIVVGDHLVLGTTAGITASGTTGGDEKVTDYNLSTGVATNFTLYPAFGQDDHNSPAFAVLPDNRILVVYSRHAADNYAFWRVSTNAGDGTAWGGQQQSTVNITNDGNGNSYSNPFYLSVPNTLYSFSRAIGYDTNYSKFNGLNSTNNSGLTNATNFAYGGHFQYWKNPSNSGNGRPYVKYISNGTNRIWLTTTEDSPQNYNNSLYCGYMEFTAAGNGTVYTSTGAALGPISTGTAPTVSQANTGAGIASGSGYSYQPTQFTPIVQASANINNYDLTSSSPYGAGYAAWGSTMLLDASGNPCIAFVVMRNVNRSYGNNLEYGYARLINGAWKVSRIGYAGWALYSGQNQYAGLIAVDPDDFNTVYFSANVDPVTGIALTAPDGNRHYQIFKGITADQGSTWAFTQLTNTSSDNIRPILATGGSKNVLLWMQGTYISYTNYTTNIVGLVQDQPVYIYYPSVILTAPVASSILVPDTTSRLHVAVSVTETDYTGVFGMQWTTVSGPANAIFDDASRADTSVRFPQTGTYTLQVTATDSASRSTTSQLTVNVTSATVASTDLVMRLKLDESSGTAVADSSGAGNNGTAMSSVVWRPVDGKVDGAAQFGASGSTITVPDAANLDGTSAFTLSYWFKMNTLIDSAGLVSKRGGGTDNNAYSTFLKSDGLLYVDIDSTSSNPQRFTSVTTFVPGQWYHIAVVFDGSLAQASRGKLYVNGTLDNIRPITNTTIQNSTANLVLGQVAGNTTVFNGLIDDVCFYRRALTDAEVATLAGKPFSPSVACGAVPSATSGVVAGLSGSATGSGVTSTWTKVSGPDVVTFGNVSSPVTTVTFARSGVYVLRLTASNATAEVSDILTVVVAANDNVYDDWISTAFPGTADASVIGFTSDPDGDAVQNGLEWALGMNPATSDAVPATSSQAGLPVLSMITVSGSTYLSLNVRCPSGRLNVTYGAKVSDDLVNWNDAVPEGGAVSNGDGTQTLTFRDTVSMSSSPRRFIRLVITRY